MSWTLYHPHPPVFDTQLCQQNKRCIIRYKYLIDKWYFAWENQAIEMIAEVAPLFCPCVCVLVTLENGEIKCAQRKIFNANNLFGEWRAVVVVAVFNVKRQNESGKLSWKMLANEYQKVNHISSSIFRSFLKWPSLCEMGNCAFMFVLIKFLRGARTQKR